MGFVEVMFVSEARADGLLRRCNIVILSSLVLLALALVLQFSLMAVQLHHADLSLSQWRTDASVQEPLLTQVMKEVSDALGETSAKSLQRETELAWHKAEEHFRVFHAHEQEQATPVKRVAVTVVASKPKELLARLLPSLVASAEQGFLYGVFVGTEEEEGRAEGDAFARQWKEQNSAVAANKSVTVKVFRFAESEGRSVWTVNSLTKEAYLEGYDYFLHAAEDAVFLPNLWTSSLVTGLQLYEDFGAMGICSESEPLLWKASLVSRVHVELFGFRFPFAFGNDLASAVSEWMARVYDHRFSRCRTGLIEDRSTSTPPSTSSSSPLTSTPLVAGEVERGKTRWAMYLCNVRKMSSFCNGYAEESVAPLPVFSDARVVFKQHKNALSRERLMAMEGKAKDQQFARLKPIFDQAKFLARQKKRQPKV